MKKNRVTYLIVIVLAVVALVLVLPNHKSTLKKGLGDFAIADTASVTKIFMADMRNNHVLLTKKSPGNWVLNDTLKARSEGLDMLLRTMMNLAVKAPVPRASYNNVIKRLATNSVKVEIYQKKYRIDLFNTIRLFPHEKRTKVYYVGSATPDNMGTFMYMEGSDTPFVVYEPGFRGFVSARFSARPNDWRDHTIFKKKPSEIKSLKIEFTQQPKESYLINMHGLNNVEVISLETGEKIRDFDARRLVDLVNGYRDIRYEAVLDAIDPAKADSIIHSTPLHIITLTDTAGNVNRVKTFRRRNMEGDYDMEGNLVAYDLNRLYALINNGKELVLIQYFVFDPITRPLSYLINKEEK
jgi:hypothetical protein